MIFKSNTQAKYRMIGLALAAIAANVGFGLAHDPSFSLQQVVLMTGLCIVATFVAFQVVSAVETVVHRRSQKN